MSASRDKEKRKAEREQGLDMRNAREKDAERKQRRNRRLTMAGCALFLIAAAFVLFVNSNFFYRDIAAVTINGERYSILEYNYFYQTAYSDFYNNNYGYYYIDSSKPLDEQSYPYGDEEQAGWTWADYFRDQAITNMRQVTMLLAAAAENDVVALDEEHQAVLDENLAYYEASAAYYSYTTDAYLAASYGQGMTAALFTDIMERVLLADQYAGQVRDEIKAGYTDEALEAYYVEKQDEFDRFTYRVYLAESMEDEEASIDAETGMNEAKEIADAIAAAGDEEELEALILEYGGEDAASSLYEGTMGSDVSSIYSEYILDADRQPGDISVIESTGGYYVVYFISRDSNEVETVNVRHILIEAEAVETEDDATDEEVAAAKAEADAAALEQAEVLLAEWEDGEATEDSFAALAEEYSADAGSNENGGLYENVYPGKMVTTFNDWCFDPVRVAGDTGIVQSDYGYHILYFSGHTGQTYRAYLAEQSLLYEDYTAWIAETTAAYTAKASALPMLFVTK